MKRESSNHPYPTPATLIFPGEGFISSSTISTEGLVTSQNYSLSLIAVHMKTMSVYNLSSNIYPVSSQSHGQKVNSSQYFKTQVQGLLCEEYPPSELLMSQRSPR